MLNGEMEYSTKGFDCGPGIETQISSTSMLNLKYKVLSKALVASIMSNSEECTLACESFISKSEISIAPSINYHLFGGFYAISNLELSSRPSISIGYSYKFNEKLQFSLSPKIGIDMQKPFFGLDFG